MSDLVEHAERMLRLGEPGAHPAGAIAGVRTSAGTAVEAAGWAALPSGDAPGVPMAPGALLDLASVTKVAATTAIIMRLVAAGDLRLEDRVRDHLPGFAGEGKGDVTLEHLLTHTAGLQPWWPLYLETTDRDAAVARAQELPLATEAGRAWRYSDLGLILAGAIVEKVTGTPLHTVYRRLVAEPLGLASGYGPVGAALAATSADSDAYEFRMVSTGIPYPVPFAAGGFPGWRDRPLRGEANDGNAAHALGGVSGHAGLFSTVDDLLTFGSALRRGDLVPPTIVERFSRPSPVHPEQAVGFRRSTVELGGEPLTLLHHGGFTGTWLALALERDVVVAGGATRLHGTVGRIPGDDSTPEIPELVTLDDIQAVLLEAAADVVAGHTASPTTRAEKR
jgi:CubicO group peptidase (beta-lactamase class C family)